jgi:hypothetical protein
VTAHENPEFDPRRDAESIFGAPETAEESNHDGDLAELFGPLMPEEEPLEGDDSATDEHLAALFAANSREAAGGDNAEPDFTWHPEHVGNTSTPAAEQDDGIASATSRGGAMAENPTPDESAAPAAIAEERVVGAETVDAVGPVGGTGPVGEAERGAGAGSVDTTAPVSSREHLATEALPAAKDEQPTIAETAPAESTVPARDAADEPADTEVLAGGAAAASTTRLIGADAEPEAVGEPEDPLAWLDRMEERPVDTPEKAALGSWLGNASAPEPTSPSAVAAAALAAPTQVLPPAPTGSFSPAPRRGIRAWSSKVRWSVAVSIVLLIGVVAAAVLISQNVAANNLAAQELAAAVAELEAAEEAATQPQSLLDDAVAEYEDTVDIAQATADNAGPPLAAVAGMAPQPLLDASNAALAALVAQLAASSIGDLPEPYERGDVDLTDIDAVQGATAAAEEHATRVITATREVRAAQAALQEKLEALRAAQVALGASLPEAAALIVEENRRALQSFKDAVIATATAVPTAQNAGGSGDAELLAYAAAVTALRADQVRAEAEVTPVRPVNPAPQPTPTTEPAPAPAPEPEPTTPPPPPVEPSPDPSPSP